VKKKFGLNVNGRTIFGLNPGAEYGPAKRWPVGKFIFAAQQIQPAHKLHLDFVWQPSRCGHCQPDRIPPISGPPSRNWNLAGRPGCANLWRF